MGITLISQQVKNNPRLRWELDDHTFFAAGACHILAYAFLQRFPKRGYRALWIKPDSGQGNHIVVSDGKAVFDYQGYTEYGEYFAHLEADWKAHKQHWYYSLIELPSEVLISEQQSKEYPGLWLREPNQFLYNALPRAERYLSLFEHSL